METEPVGTAQLGDLVPAWRLERTVHEGSLDGATLTGEAARHPHAIRIGLWLDEAGVVKQARWRADDTVLGAYAEAACHLVESGVSPFLLRGDALRAAVAQAPGSDHHSELVVCALGSALLLWAGADA